MSDQPQTDRAHAGRFALRVSTSEVAGPPGRGSVAEREAQKPRPNSGVRLTTPPAWCGCGLQPEHLHDEDGVPYDPRVSTPPEVVQP